MRGIPEEILKELIERATLDGNDLLTTVYTQLLNRYCQELQEPWMTLDEFLKSGFEGLCWIKGAGKHITAAYYNEGKFWPHKSSVIPYPKEVIGTITRVIPIHKPEPPKL